MVTLGTRKSVPLRKVCPYRSVTQCQLKRDVCLWEVKNVVFVREWLGLLLSVHLQVVSTSRRYMLTQVWLRTTVKVTSGNYFLNLVGSIVTIWLLCRTPVQAVWLKVLARVIALCCWAGHVLIKPTVTVLLSNMLTQVCKWLAANLMT